MFALRELTLTGSRDSRGTGGGDGVPCGIFHYIYKGWSGLTLSLTSRQDEFGEDLSGEEMRTKT
jgi:hypothetical protein